MVFLVFFVVVVALIAVRRVNLNPVNLNPKLPQTPNLVPQTLSL